MEQSNILDTLEIQALRRIFTGLSSEQKEALVRDLMGEAGIDSICRLNRVIIIGDIDITAPPNETPEAKDLRLYRERFEAFVMPFLSSFLCVINKSYMDECFEIYQILAERSVGGRFRSQADPGDKFIWALTKNRSASDHENFRNDMDKRKEFEEAILNPSKVHLNVFQLTADFPDENRMTIKFVDLLVLLKNSREKAYIVLFLLGYLEGHRFYEQTKGAFLLLFPGITDFAKLQPMFTLDVDNDWRYSCPDFPGLMFWSEDVNVGFF